MLRPIHIVQISGLATACIGQPLLKFWSHTEQSWMFSLIVAALKITYDKFERDCSQVMHNVNVYLVNIFVRFACTLMLMVQFSTVIVQRFI